MACKSVYDLLMESSDEDDPSCIENFLKDHDDSGASTNSEEYASEWLEKYEPSEMYSESTACKTEKPIENDESLESKNDSELADGIIEGSEHEKSDKNVNDDSVKSENDSGSAEDDLQETEHGLKKAKKAAKEMKKMIADIQTKKSAQKARWNDYTVLILLDQYQKKKHNKKSVWTEITDYFKAKGYDFKHDQIKRKFNKLFGLYKKAKEQNNKTGNSPATSPYYEIFEDMFSKSHNVTPVYACSLIKPLQGEIQKKIDFETDDLIMDEKEVDNDDKTVLIQQKDAQKRKISNNSDVLEQIIPPKKTRKSDMEQWREYCDKRDDKTFRFLKKQNKGLTKEIREIGNILRDATNLDKKV